MPFDPSHVNSASGAGGVAEAVWTAHGGPSACSHEFLHVYAQIGNQKCHVNVLQMTDRTLEDICYSWPKSGFVKMSELKRRD